MCSMRHAIVLSKDAKKRKEQKEEEEERKCKKMRRKRHWKRQRNNMIEALNGFRQIARIASFSTFVRKHGD